MPKKQPAVTQKQLKKLKQPDTGEAVVKQKKDNNADTLQQVVTDFEQSWKYCQNSWHDRWLNNYRAYNNERVKVGYNGITDTYIPMVFSTVETLCSGLFGAKPKFNYLPPQQKQEQRTDILNALLDFYWEKDQWSLKMIDVGRGMLREGTSISYFCWNIDHPVMIVVPIRDFFIDPAATSLENARYMGRRYLTTIDELKTYQIIDLDNPTETPLTDDNGQPNGQTQIDYPLKPKYNIPANWDKLVNQAKGPNTGQQKTDKQEKDELYGSTLEDLEGQVEVIEYWTGDKTISVLNRGLVIENAENYFKSKDRANQIASGTDPENVYAQGIMPFADCRDFVDASLFYAKSEVDFILDQQELLNDITNQRVDAVTYLLNPMFTLDPKYADKIEEVESLPGAVYPFEAGTLQRIEMGTIPPDAFSETTTIKNDIRETTASNEVVKGVPADGGKATATEINAQVAGAGQRINLKITQLENGYFHRVARIILAMVRLYVTEPMMVRVIGKDGADWQQFDPSEFNEGDYEPQVQLDIAIENQKQQDASNAKEMYAAFLNDPDVNQQELKKLVLAKGFHMDPDEVSTLMTPPQPMMPPGMPGQPGASPFGDMQFPQQTPLPPMPGQNNLTTDPISQGLVPLDSLVGGGVA